MIVYPILNFVLPLMLSSFILVDNPSRCSECQNKTEHKVAGNAVIERIPEIDTDVAREKIKERLIKEPADYIKSFQQFMSKQDSSIKVEALVAMGKQLQNYQTWIDEHEIDLVIMNTKDENQLAMHGLAHPLVIEYPYAAIPVRCYHK
mgnify:CR=1 FL=1